MEGHSGALPSPEAQLNGYLKRYQDGKELGDPDKVGVPCLLVTRNCEFILGSLCANTPAGRERPELVGATVSLA